MTVSGDSPTFTGQMDLDTVLLLLILLVLVARLFFTVRDHRKKSPLMGLMQHNDDVSEFLRVETHDEQLERLILSEAMVAAEIDIAMQRISEMPPDNLRALLEKHGYRDVNDDVVDWIRQNLNWRNARWVGGKVLEKVLGVANKKFGIAT